MVEAIPMWHPGVHRRVRESLYYFLVKVDRYFSSRFPEYFVSHIAKRMGLASYCVYELYGAFDVLIRVWINPINLVDFVNRLARRAKAVMEFSVGTVRLCWCFPQLEHGSSPNALQEITKESILKAQQGDEEAAERFVENGLLVRRPTFPSEESIKFFIAVSMPSVEERSALDRILSDMKAALLADENIDNRSLYEGAGFAWVLVKGTTRNVFSIRRLLVKLAENTEPYGARTTTYIVATNQPLEVDGIGEGTLAALDAWDPAIDAWLPELYRDLGPGSPLKVDIERFLRSNLLDVNLTDDDAVQMKNFFRSVVHQQKPLASAFGMELFARLEAILRHKLGRFLAHTYGPSDVARKLTDFEMPTEPKRMTLREVLASYKRVLQDRYPEHATRLMPRNPDNIEAARNGLAHGWKNPVESWKEVGEALFELVVKGRALVDFVNEHVGDDGDRGSVRDIAKET